ncbi:uncharacterized protein UHO2_00475 [Ustilago hordei]|uniref:uncharacterized protein n=1 Tax=Ustilago hordei TaxID=120017 RepID=UPI001A3AD1ED|nr:uncharacterized protein UHO2_00475 [Ustilago hordei]SYW81990.1 uncharacterized protein UHO2_00475 [Ustilago hordei]
MEATLRRELRTWQRAFKAQHGRDPTKRDILTDPEIAGIYDTWQAVGGDLKTAKSKPHPRVERGDSVASSSKQRLDEGLNTPSKKKPSHKEVETEVGRGNPFKTPTKTPSRKKNPWVTPSKSSAIGGAGEKEGEASPACSMIEVEMTPTKRSPLLDILSKRNTASRPPQGQEYVTASPSKLRTTLTAASRLTPTKKRLSPTRMKSDAALSAALVAYTPRTKARKRLRGEDVPPTPNRRRVSDSNALVRGGVVEGEGNRTAPRAVQKGLGAFGFGSQRKSLGGVVGRSVTAPASVFSRARSIPHPPMAQGEEDAMVESPIKSISKLRRAASAKPGFRPLFASPSGNHAPQNVLGISDTTALPRSSPTGAVGGEEEDADAVMADDTSAPIGGLFAAEVQKRRLRRARETGEEEALEGKKHKSRTELVLPSSSDGEEETGGYNDVSSSPAYRSGAGATSVSSPFTELTVPSSAAKIGCTKERSDASSPLRPSTGAIAINSEKSNASVEGWRKVQTLELSDEDEPRKSHQTLKPSAAGKRIISITPYQRYGTLRQNPSLPSIGFNSDPEEEFGSYSLLLSTQRPTAGKVAVASASDSEEDQHEASSSLLARLKLSPVRHAPTTNKQQRDRLLNSIFDPASARKKAGKVLNPEARFGDLQPSSSFGPTDELDDEAQGEGRKASKGLTRCTGAGSDDDDDWQNEVDEDFTFFDSEIELRDIA